MARVPSFVYALVLLGIGGGVLGFVRSRPPQVDVVLPVQKTVVETIAASGRLRGVVETSVGARMSGRLASVPVREGDRVKQGQLLATLDDEVLRSQLVQAEVAVQTAQAQVLQASDAITTARAQLSLAARPPLSSDVTRLKADTNQAVAVAAARLAGAQQKRVLAQRRLAELKKGPREEEIDAALALVRQAEATQTQAQRDRDRQLALVKEGAVAQSIADQAETNYLVAKRTLENAQARLKQLQAGTRVEQLEQADADVRSAEADVHAAEATLTGARASGQAQLTSLLASPRPEDIVVAKNKLAEVEQARTVAQARLSEAERAREVAKQRLGDVKVTAPFEGTVTQIVTEAGGLTGPSAPIVRLVRTTQPEIRIDLDEINLGKLKLGQEAVVSSDAFPNQTFKAKVREIGAQVDTERGTVEVRLTPLQPPSWVRPGQTLSVNIIVDAGQERLVVPLTAVNTVGGVSTVLVVEGGVLIKKTVKVGAPGPDGIPILEGLGADAQVLPIPASRKPGDAVAAHVVKKAS